MPFLVRPFEKQDYKSLVTIANAIYPEYRKTTEEWQRGDQLFDETRYVRLRYVAVDEETQRVVGYGSVQHNPGTFHPQKFWLTLMVHPDWQRKGVGRTIYERLNAHLRELNAITVWTNIREDHADALVFFERRGFAEVRREWELRLPVEEVDTASFLSVLKRVQEQGIVIVTLLEEREHDRDYLRKVYELSNAILADVPMPDQWTGLSFEEFERQFNYPGLLPEAYFIAKHGDLYIGRSDLWRLEAEPDRLYQGVTGVLREYRRKGVATALKVKAIEYTKQHGYKFITTWNDSENVAMLSLNEKLGFRRQIGWVAMEKTL